MATEKTKFPWVVMRGGIAEGFDIFGPFESEEEATYFESFFCNVDCHSESFEVLPPSVCKPMDGDYTWAEIKKQFDDPEIRKRTR